MFDEKLMFTERLAELGNIVDGSTHEINNPLGIGITAASHLKEKTKKLQKMIQEDTLQLTDVEKHLETLTDLSEMIFSNLTKTADLVRNLKVIAVDQCSEDKRSFSIKEYFDDILLSLRPKLKRTKHKITINCSEYINMYSRPGIIYQILRNLVENTIVFGFKNIDAGEILINVYKKNSLLFIEYRDDGEPFEKEHFDKLLPLPCQINNAIDSRSIDILKVNKLLSEFLSGEIEYHTTSKAGVAFVIKIPLNN